MIAAILQLESRGMDVVGIYHSIPLVRRAVRNRSAGNHLARGGELIWSPGREDWQLRAFGWIRVAGGK
jgi:hypothetical protein